LRLSGLSAGARNLDLIDPILAKLRKPVQCGEDRLPALLKSVLAEGERLRLEVCGDWLAPPFGKVPMPLPTRSAHALALYLFVHTIKTSNANKGDSSFLSLCTRLGIKSDQRWQCQQAFDRALAVVNTHLSKLDIEELARNNVKIARAFDLVPTDGGLRVRLEATNRQTRAAARHNKWKRERIEAVPGSRYTFRRVRNESAPRQRVLTPDEIEVEAIRRDADDDPDLYRRLRDAARRGNKAAREQYEAKARELEEESVTQEINASLDRRRILVD
jgi:hypothetical protein